MRSIPKRFVFYAIVFLTLLGLPGRPLIAEIINFPAPGAKINVREGGVKEAAPILALKQGEPTESSSATTSLVLETDEDTFLVGKIVRVDIALEPGESAINAAMAVLKYSTSTLKLLAVDYETSDFSISLEEFLLENLAIITCLEPAPGVSRKGRVASLVFETVAPGEAQVSFIGGSKALASDGLGTDVLAETRNLSFRVN